MTQDLLFGGPPAEVSAGTAAVTRWSTAIHGGAGDRHEWALEAGRLLDEHGPGAELPPFPSPHQSVRDARERTARRLHAAAAGRARRAGLR